MCAGVGDAGPVVVAGRVFEVVEFAHGEDCLEIEIDRVTTGTRGVRAGTTWWMW